MVTKPIPKNTIEIGGHTVTISEEENLLQDRGHYGEWCYRDLSIVVYKGSDPTVRQQTLLHEVFEAINELYELDLTHNKIQTLASAMYQVMTKNKDMFGKV